jgi:hypothetical protein
MNLMQTVLGVTIIGMVALSSLVFLVICLLMAENLLFAHQTPRISEWFLRHLRESRRAQR